MSLSTIGTALPRRLATFDDVATRFGEALTSFTEEEALQASHWEMGEDARLREDVRFRVTPWGRWIRSGDLLANDALFSSLLRGAHSEVELATALTELAEVTRRRCVFCPGDDRFVLHADRLRLSAKYLSDQPRLTEEVTELEQYTTHLPVHSLAAAAASEPAGEWGARAQEEVIETLGWLRVKLSGGRRLNPRMFVARLEGRSMDDGRSGLVDGGYAVFELWPAGSRQHLRVLVRGTFTDPETGSYAVKKYVADPRDEDGRHQRIRLVSLNPDRGRYPDIELQVEDEEAVTVVARVIQPLAPADYERRPRPVRRPGRRNLLDPAEQQNRLQRMQERIERFFDGRPGEAGPEAPGEQVERPTRLVCLDHASGGLWLETQPLSWLPPFVKQLTLRSGAGAVTLVASNLRHRRWRTPVAPSGAPYCWSAPGHDDLLAEELATLEVLGLPEDRVALFRIDAAGVGQPLTGRALFAANDYRLLVPPAVPLPEGLPGEQHALEAGWRLWELPVPAAPDASFRSALAHLGLEVGAAAALVRWVLRSPTAYQVTPGGEAYPVFEPGEGPIVAIGGLRALRPGEVLLLLASETATTTQPLDPGEAWTVELAGLAPGRYLLQVLHERTRFAGAQLPFAVVSGAARKLSASLSASHAQLPVRREPDDRFLLELDCSDSAKWEPLTITAPPLWSFDVRWDDGRPRPLGRLFASAGGELDLAPLATRLVDAVARCSLGTLWLDGAELGLVELDHQRRASVPGIRSQLAKLVDERLASAVALDGQLELLRNVWLHPVLAVMGYGCKPPAEADLEGAPPGTTGLRLVVHQREGEHIRPRTSRALVLAPAACDLNSFDLFSPRRYADLLCRRWSVGEALVTDGVRWVKHTRDVHVKRRVHRIDEVVRSSDLFTFDEFLGEFAVVAVEG